MTTIPQTGPRSFDPRLQEVSQLASAIVNATQKIRRNKTTFKRLANDASELVDDMSHFYRIMEKHFPEGAPEELSVIFQRTVNCLDSIRSFTREVASRNMFMAFLFSRSDVGKIAVHDQTLAMNKGLFKMISNSHMQKFATKLSAENLEALVQRFEVPVLRG